MRLRLALLLFTVLLAGCGRSGPDFCVTLDDAKGLKKDARVLWRGAEAGKVSSVDLREGKFRIEVRLNSSFRGQIRSDVRAQAANGITTKFAPVVELFGGTDP